MTFTEATAKLAKTFGLLLLLAVMTTVPVFVHSAVPRTAWGSTSSASTVATSFSGEAFDAAVTTLVTPRTTFVDTGPLPPSGGTIDATVVSVPLPGGSADALVAVTMGFDSKAQSEAAVATVSTTLPVADSPAITADFISAESIATCTGVSGSSTITNLKIDSLPPIVVTGAPNQVVPNPLGLTIILNEQITTSNSITVNAIHVSDSLAGLDIIISSASSDITCATPVHVPHDFATGGGWIQVTSGKGTFGFVAGFKDDSSTPSGHLTYIDHSTGIKVMSTDMLSYGNSPSCPDTTTQRTFSGDAQINGQSGSYTVCVTDNGEPGVNNDVFSISLSNGYAASGTLGGGNIEIHN